MTLSSYEINDLERLINEIAAAVELTEDTAYVALVRAPSTDQELVEVRRLDLPALLDDDENISRRLRDVARSFALPAVHPPGHSLVTVIVRPGRCIAGPNEAVWLKGWRYARHVEPVWDSDLILVTEHGWTDLSTQWAGHQPRMVAGIACRLRLPSSTRRRSTRDGGQPPPHRSAPRSTRYPR